MTRIDFRPRTLITGARMEPGIGDVLFAEPALRQRATLDGAPVLVAVTGNAQARDLLDGNPFIRLAPPGFHPEEDDPGWCPIRVEPVARVVSHGWHWIESYYPQLGMDPLAVPEVERVPRLFGFPNDGPRLYMDCLAIAPFSASDASVMFGRHPNKLLPYGWWEELVRRLDVPVVCLGHAGAPLIGGTLPFYGHPLREVAAVIRSSRGLLAVANGMAVLAAAVDTPVAMLVSADPAWTCQARGHAPVWAVASPFPPSWDLEGAVQTARLMLSPAPSPVCGARRPRAAEGAVPAPEGAVAPPSPLRRMLERWTSLFRRKEKRPMGTSALRPAVIADHAHRFLADECQRVSEVPGSVLDVAPPDPESAAAMAAALPSKRFYVHLATGQEGCPLAVRRATAHIGIGPGDARPMSGREAADVFCLVRLFPDDPDLTPTPGVLEDLAERAWGRLSRGGTLLIGGHNRSEAARAAANHFHLRHADEAVLEYEFYGDGYAIFRRKP